MPFLRRAAAGPSPAIRARVASLFEPPAGAAIQVDAVDSVAGEAGEGAAARFDPGPRGAAALVALAVAAVAVAGAVVWRGRPQPVDVVAPPALVVTPPPPSAALLVVDVSGDVRRPGLVRLPAGSRVADALAAAGGLRRGASTAGLNLARKLVDGEQVLVGGPAAAAGQGSAGAAGAAGAPGAPGAVAGQPLNLNAATAAQLDGLPGIGPVLAERIVEWRTAHGAFTSVDQLREVSGIGARKFESIRELVTV